MGKFLLEHIPDMMTFFYTFLVFAIPYTVYKVNQKLHKYGDQPWKKEDE